MRTCTLTEAESDLSALVRHVQVYRDRVALTREGSPLAILISVEELDSLEETLAVLSEVGALDEIIGARDSITAEGLIPPAEVMLRNSNPSD